MKKRKTNSSKIEKRTEMRYIFLIIAIAFLSPAWAQKSLSLQDAISIALENNYDIQLSKQKVKSAEIRNNWGTVGAYPSFSLMFASNNDINDVDPEDYTRNQLMGDAKIRWTIFDGFSIRSNKHRLNELENLSKGNLAVLIENTVQSVILAYNNVLLQSEKLNVLKQSMELSEDRFKRAETQKELGAAVTYEVLQAKNAYLADKASFLLQEVTYKNAKRNLKFLLGNSTKEIVEVNGKLDVVASTYQLKNLLEKMHMDNSNLKNQYLNIALLQRDVAIAKSDYYPTLSLSAGASNNHMKFNYDKKADVTNDSWQYYGNLTLSYTLFNGGNRKRAVQLAKLEEESGNITLDQVKHSLDNQLLNLYDFHSARKALLEVATENLAAAELNLQISSEKLKSGAINSFNYRDVQLIYVNAAQRKLEAVYNLIDSQTSLLRITGGIIQEYQK
ncbi:TolC family protein [Prolixibacteraceae bacterium JC049]|nr:TolC family protein [Prolixibacteraceae bacterium JC049]